MSNVIVSPNMNLPVPVVGVDSGPDWATNINSCLSVIDGHNHTTGNGVQIPVAGLNINSNLTFNSNSATGVGTVNFNAYGSPLAGTSPNLGCLYVAGNELYYNDEAGNQVKMTSSGSVNATSSGISSGTASAAFSSGVLVVKSSSSSGANTLMQSVVLTNSGNLINQLTLQAPTLSSSYSLTLPSIPGAIGIVTIDTSGNFGTTQSVTPPSSACDPIGVNMSSTGANAIAASRTRTIGTSYGDISLSNSCGLFSTSSPAPVAVTNLSVGLQTSGRPVFVGLISDNSGTSAYIGLSPGGAGGNLSVYIYRNGSLFAEYLLDVGSSSTYVPFIYIPASTVWWIDTGAAGVPSSYAYEIYMSTGQSASMNNVKLIAYEL